ncbi:hypothetical protein B0H14DRAFT_3166605 [Mycena olivaceomarginata]|nr:hypothetical protein B0H14DRAFT_3166605 [Mycena olivaceomarginata]
MFQDKTAARKLLAKIHFGGVSLRNFLMIMMNYGSTHSGCREVLNQPLPLRTHLALQVAVVFLVFCAPGVLPMTITGPSSAQSNGPITFTWTSVSTDPTIFEIDIDLALNSLNQSDSYFIQHDLDTAGGSTTFTLPDLSVGTHRIAFSSNDGFQILDEGSIEILAAGSSPSPSSSGTPSSSTAPAPSPPASPTSSSSSTSSLPPIAKTPSNSFIPSISSISSISLPSSTQTATNSSSFASSPPPIPILTTSSISTISQSSSTQTATSGLQNIAPKHHTNAAAIAGGVAGGTVVILLALLGWWYLRRREASGEKSPNEIRPFLASPVSSAFTGAPASHNGSDIHEFRSREDNGTSAVPSTTPVVSSAGTSVPTVSMRTATGVTDRKQSVMDPPVITTTQSDPGPSCEELLEEVQRLRQHIDIIPPPSYPGV